MKEVYTFGNKKYIIQESWDGRDGPDRWFVIEVTKPRLPYNTNHGLFCGKLAALAKLKELTHCLTLPAPDLVDSYTVVQETKA